MPPGKGAPGGSLGGDEVASSVLRYGSLRQRLADVSLPRTPAASFLVKGAAMLGAMGDLGYIAAAGLLGGGDRDVDGPGAR
jgi:hypothetical protein